jgi:hypothetical protein
VYESVLGLEVLGSQFGASMHLPPSSNVTTTNLLYRSVNETKSYMSLSSLNVNAHWLENYFEKLCNLVQYASNDPLDVSGYGLDMQCTNNEECSSFVLNGSGGCIDSYCENEQQQLAANGESCNDGSDCESNRCDYTWTGTKVCYEQKESGSLCDEDSDCQSSRCTWSWTCQ